LRSSGSPPVMRIFSHAEVDENAARRADLLEAQQLLARQEGVVVAEHLAWACNTRSGSCSGR
jgi:predicted alternative tryptophan synthase beta-subunit